MHVRLCHYFTFNGDEVGAGQRPAGIYLTSLKFTLGSDNN